MRPPVRPRPPRLLLRPPPAPAQPLWRCRRPFLLLQHLPQPHRHPRPVHPRLRQQPPPAPRLHVSPLRPSPSRRAYLSAGAAALPLVYSLLFLAYAWVAALLRRHLAAYRIHYFMLAVLVLKALNLLCEAEDKSYIQRTGSAHGWDVLFYIFSFLKGVSLFTLLVLIGTGWSFLKPYLQDRDKKVLMAVIPLQVVANTAQVAIDESGPYARDWVAWRQVFLLVDVVCCCAVLFPIVWSINNLREAARTDDKAAVNLTTLTLPPVLRRCHLLHLLHQGGGLRSRHYHLVPVPVDKCYRRVACYPRFYVFTGYKFRPGAHNPCFAIDEEEEEAAAEALKLTDDFELRSRNFRLQLGLLPYEECGRNTKNRGWI